MEERLQKILSRAGIASRRGAEKVMAEARLTVNGKVVTELGTKADAAKDDIRVDGVRVRPAAEPVYLLLFKPKGVVTTRHDPEGRTTVMDLVPKVAGLFPVGRLDVTTEGLLLLTNDGAFAERVAHPRFEVARVYEAKVHRVPDAETVRRLRRGVVVEGQRMSVDRVRLLEADKNAWVEVTLHEGKHHEVKRLLEAVGHPVSKLKRVAVGSLTLKGLKPGGFRALTPQEVKAFRGGPGLPRARTAPAEVGGHSKRPAWTRRPGTERPGRTEHGGRTERARTERPGTGHSGKKNRPRTERSGRMERSGRTESPRRTDRRPRS